MKINGNGHAPKTTDTRKRSPRRHPLAGYRVQEMQAHGLAGFGVPTGDRTRSSGSDLAASLGFSITPFDGGESIQNLYAESLWIRAAIKAKAAGIGALEFEVLDEEDGEAIEAHPLLALLANPNPLYTAKEFWRA